MENDKFRKEDEKKVHGKGIRTFTFFFRSSYSTFWFLIQIPKKLSCNIHCSSWKDKLPPSSFTFHSALTPMSFNLNIKKFQHLYSERGERERERVKFRLIHSNDYHVAYGSFSRLVNTNELKVDDNEHDKFQNVK